MIMLIIVSMIGGGSMGALEPIRVLSIVFAPFAFQLFMKSTDSKLKSVILFLFIWFIYMIISLCWTTDVNNGKKELLYYLIHFFLFIEIVIFSKKSNNPLLTIAFSWCLVFLLTSVVAMWEITTNNHLASSVQAENSIVQGYGGYSYNYRFAAVNFGNYNTYSTFICFCFPFILYALALAKFRLLAFAALFLSCYIVIFNASRGALASIAIMLILFGYSFLSSNHKSKYKIGLILASILAIVYFSYKWNFIAGFLLFRSENSDLITDDTRISLWIRSLYVLRDTLGLGSGIGSVYQSAYFSPHNAFIELLMQYGIIVFLFIVVYLFRFYFDFRKNSDRDRRTIGYCALLSMPFYMVIDSGYLLKPQLWIFFSSLYVFCYHVNQYNHLRAR